jgi:hypothetical protein
MLKSAKKRIKFNINKAGPSDLVRKIQHKKLCLDRLFSLRNKSTGNEVNLSFGIEILAEEIRELETRLLVLNNTEFIRKDK